MKPNELLKIIDSGSIEKIRIYYCGGHIDVEIPFAPFELPDYEIAKIGLYENGNGITLLLADNVTKFEMPDAMPKEETTSKERRTAEIKPSKITDDDAIKAIYLLNDYCRQFRDGCKNCIFDYGNDEPCGIRAIPEIIKDFETKGGK